MNNYVIDIEHLTKKFGDKTVVDDLSLKVKKGSVFGFLGSNGSGKTTTIRMICGLLTPTAGQGQCLGFDIIRESAAIKRRIGYMSQKFSFYMGLTVKENLRFVADAYQINSPASRIQNIIKDLELNPYENIKAVDLSGGWKQRLALACCILHQPELLFLDEPTAGVDPKARKDFWDYLHQISLRDGTTVLVTTHYMDEAEKCQHLAYIYLGKLLYSGDNKDLIPFSQVKAYVLKKSAFDIATLFSRMKKHYPSLLVSLTGNTLRVASRNINTLNTLFQEEQESLFEEVPPSFEEAFIELVPK